jgi:hypothetical protein
MNLKENIQRIRSMMGVITENIDDVLDKINQGDSLSYEDRHKMSKYEKHLSSGGNENDFEYHRVSDLNIAEPNSKDHQNESQIIVYHNLGSGINPKYISKKIAMTLSKSNIESVVGSYFVIFTMSNGYFVKVNKHQVDKALSVLKENGFDAGINPAYGTLYNEPDSTVSKMNIFKKNTDILISKDSDVYQKFDLDNQQFNDRLSKLLKKFGINNFLITKNKVTISDKSKIDDLIQYLNKKGYNTKRA